MTPRGPLRGVVVEPQLGLDYGAQLAAARAAEAVGLAAFYRSDHYTTPFAVEHPVWTDAWAALAGIARETQQIRLGTLVSPVSFRPAGVIAAVAATVQAMSDGRVELGLGAGWDAEEHARFGIPFHPLGARLDALEHQALEVRALWDDLLPGDRAPGIIMGGTGGPRSCRIAARVADAYNILRAGPERVRDVNRQLDRMCAEVGRNPATLRRSVLLGLLIGRDGGEYARRRARLGSLLGLGGAVDDWLGQRVAFWVHGGPGDLAERLAAYAAVGCDEVVFEVFDGEDLELIRLAGEVGAAT